MRSLRRFVALGLIALAGAACSGVEAAEPANCDGNLPSQTTVTVWAHEGSEAGPISDAIDRFNAGPGGDQGITAELTLIPEGQYTNQIQSAAAAQDVPDVLDLDGPTMANFAWAGALKPLDPCVPEELRQNLLPSIIQQGSYADHLYALGSFDSGLGLYAWRSALEEVGARIPEAAEDAWTADEFEQILRDLQDAGYDAPLDPKFWYGSQGEWFSYAYTPILWSAGAGMIGGGGTGPADGTINSDAAVQAFERFQSWVQQGLVDTDAADDSNFLQKRAPISWVGHWMYAAYSEAAGDDLVVLPLPDFGDGSKTGMGSWAWGMGRGVEEADAAWAVIDYMLSDDVILAITDANGAIPATRSAIAKSPLHREGGPLRLFVDQLEAAPDVAHPRPVTPGYPVITQTFASTLDDIIQGADVRTSLDEAATTIDEDYDENQGYPAPDVG